MNEREAKVLLPTKTLTNAPWRFYIMRNLSKKRRVINYLTSGKGLTSAEAASRFGVGNMRAMMSDIRSQFEKYGNWEVVTEETSTGKTRSFLNDTHPGERTYAYNEDGSKYMMA